MESHSLTLDEGLRISSDIQTNSHQLDPLRPTASNP